MGRQPIEDVFRLPSSPFHAPRGQNSDAGDGDHQCEVQHDAFGCNGFPLMNNVVSSP
jgi:hypothetical protein